MTFKWSVLWVLMCFIICTNAGGYNTTLKKKICNGTTYRRHKLPTDSHRPYECAVNHLVQTILDKAPKARDYEYYDFYGCAVQDETGLAYGYGSCNGKLGKDECSKCMANAHDELFKECRHSIGAQVELEDCMLRYENYSFIED